MPAYTQHKPLKGANSGILGSVPALGRASVPGAIDSATPSPTPPLLPLPLTSPSSSPSPLCAYAPSPYPFPRLLSPTSQPHKQPAPLCSLLPSFSPLWLGCFLCLRGSIECTGETVWGPAPQHPPAARRSHYRKSPAHPCSLFLVISGPVLLWCPALLFAHRIIES